MKKYFKLLRIKHYLKNILLFIPLIFSQNMLNINYIIKLILAFIAFSFIASSVYIINDIKDKDKDKLHEIKKKRPIASGEISVKNAIIICIILLIISSLINILICNNYYTIILLYGYLIINILYTIKLKEIPIIDCIVLSSGFIIRILYGASIINVEVSKYLYLTILFAALYVVLGKRRNEIIKHGNKSREVLNFYTKEFLDKNMYVFFALTIAFYSLWCMNYNTISKIKLDLLLISIPIVTAILMKYSLNIEKNSEGDPVDVIISDKILLLSILILGIYMICTIYFF